MHMCMRCGTFTGQPRPVGPVVCDRCWHEANAERERLAQLGDQVPTAGSRIVGPQPAICQWCSEPFMAAHAGVKFHSSACRARAWRAAHRATAA